MNKSEYQLNFEEAIVARIEIDGMLDELVDYASFATTRREIVAYVKDWLREERALNDYSRWQNVWVHLPGNLFRHVDITPILDMIADQLPEDHPIHEQS